MLGPTGSPWRGGARGAAPRACLHSLRAVLQHAPGAKKSDDHFGQVPLDKATEYAADHADVTLRVWMILKARLAAERMTTVYETLERPMIPVLSQMERTGVKVDNRPVAAHIHVLPAHSPAEEIYTLAGHKLIRAPLVSSASSCSTA